MLNVQAALGYSNSQFQRQKHDYNIVVFRLTYVMSPSVTNPYKSKRPLKP